MTDYVLPHAPVFAAPKPRVPAPDQTIPELWCDPRMGDDPIGLMCDLANAYGEDRAVSMWIWATMRLRTERQRAISDLLFIARQQGPGA